MTTPPVPIVCDMTNAPDTSDERIAEYQELFGNSLIGREHIAEGIRFRFPFEPDLEARIRDLAAREKACCAFFTFDIARHGDELWWDSSVVDDPIAHQILDEYYRLPDTAHEGVARLHQRFARDGLNVVIEDNGSMRPATDDELGISSP